MKYTVLTFEFGDYDYLRRPKEVDPDAEYICVTDDDLYSDVWKIVHDPRLDGKDPLYKAYYVRYHAFEYASTDVVVVVDASMLLRKSLGYIVDVFNKHGRDYGVMLSNMLDDEQKFEFWTKDHPRLSKQDDDNVRAMIRKLGFGNLKGSIGTGIRILRRTKRTIRLDKHIWRYALATGHEGKPNRMDEIIMHHVIAKEYMNMKFMIYSMQLAQSPYISYFGHHTDIKVRPLPQNYDEIYHLCNVPVSPYRFEDERVYPLNFKYDTEAMLLTKYLSFEDMREWLDWHLYRCGIDHIHIFDNGLDFDLSELSKYYGDRISFEKVEGKPRQYALYDEYILKKSEAQWIMPIDDDEYLNFSPEFKKLIDVIQYYRKKIPLLNMLAVRWLHLFPESFQTEREGMVLKYCTRPNPYLATRFMHLGDRAVKTIVRRYGHIHYEETWENPAGGHVPKNSIAIGARMFDGTIINGCGLTKVPEDIKDEKIRLLHCRYKGPKDWMKKYGNADPLKNCVRVSDKEPKPKFFEFNYLLPLLK